MNLQRFWYLLTIFGVLVITFYFGFLYGRRDLIDSQNDNVVVVGPNLSIQNSLTQMEIRTIKGSVDSQNEQVFGQLYFKVTDDNKTEILIRLSAVPLQVSQTNKTITKPIPNELLLATATRTRDGLDFEYKNFGKLIFDEPNQNLRSASFSSILDRDLTAVERIVFLPASDGDENIFVDTDPDLPTQVRNRPSPYFWSTI